MRPYFYDNRPLSKTNRMTESGAERTRSQVLAVAEFMLDTFFECIWDHNDKNDDEEDRSCLDGLHQGRILPESPT